MKPLFSSPTWAIYRAKVPTAGVPEAMLSKGAWADCCRSFVPFVIVSDGWCGCWMLRAAYGSSKGRFDSGRLAQNLLTSRIVRLSRADRLWNVFPSRFCRLSPLKVFASWYFDPVLVELTRSPRSVRLLLTLQTSWPIFTKCLINILLNATQISWILMIYCQ